MENMTDRFAAQKALAAAHFAAFDANLFLDTHPDCTLALEYFYDRQDEYADLLAAYVDRFGPVCAGDDGMSDKWLWVNKPWPWQLEG